MPEANPAQNRQEATRRPPHMAWHSPPDLTSPERVGSKEPSNSWELTSHRPAVHRSASCPGNPATSGPGTHSNAPENVPCRVYIAARHQTAATASKFAGTLRHVPAGAFILAGRLQSASAARPHIMHRRNESAAVFRPMAGHVHIHQAINKFALHRRALKRSVHASRRRVPPESSARQQQQHQSATTALWRQRRERAFRLGPIAGACSAKIK